MKAYRLARSISSACRAWKVKRRPDGGGGGGGAAAAYLFHRDVLGGGGAQPTLTVWVLGDLVLADSHELSGKEHKVD